MYYPSKTVKGFKMAIELTLEASFENVMFLLKMLGCVKIERSTLRRKKGMKMIGANVSGH